MNPAIVYLIKVICCSAFLYLYYLIALRNKGFHQWNRFYLLSIVFFSVLVPFISIERLFSETVNKAPDSNFLKLLYSSNGLFANEGALVPNNIVFIMMVGLYSIVSITMLTSTVFFIKKINHIIQSHTASVIEDIKIINSALPNTPFTFLKYIFWNRNIDLQTASGQQILKHEMVHIRDKHTYDKLFMQVVLAFFWCNPIFWLLRAELNAVHEFIADKKSVDNNNTAQFAAAILQVAYPQHYHQLTSSFFQTSIKRRLVMLTKKQNLQLAYLSRMLALPVVTIAFVSFASKATLQFSSAEKNNIVQQTNVTTDTLPEQMYKGKKIRAVNVVEKNQKIVLTLEDGSKKTITVTEAKELNMLPPPPPPPPPPAEMMPTPPPPQPQKSADGKNASVETPDDMGETLIILDGVEKGRRKDFADFDAIVKAEDIKSVNVLKGNIALKKYGDKAKAGVIEIETKK